MRILHTSDWHLGQHFMGRTREREHKAFLDWLLDLIDRKKADALVVAGDIFDTGTPPSYARTLYNEFIVSLQQTCCNQALILGGNHDSAATLNEARALLACLNTRVVAGVSDQAGDHVLTFSDSKGRPALLVCAVPFLRPRDLITSLAGQTGQDKQDAMARAISLFYEQVYEEAQTEQARLARDGFRVPVMATGHLTVVGGRASESVREIYIGTLDAFPGSGFPGADYIALGHLHRAQAIKSSQDPAHIRYSGSPIPLSFDEGQKEKQVLCVDFEAGGLKAVTPVQVPCFRRLVSVRGSLDQIEARINELAASSPKGLWLEAEVVSDDYLTDLQERILNMINGHGEAAPSLDLHAGPDPAAAIELLRVRRRRNQHQGSLVPEAREKLEELSPEEVFQRRLAREELDHDQAGMLTRLFDQVLSRVRGEEI